MFKGIELNETGRYQAEKLCKRLVKNKYKSTKFILVT